MIASATQVKSRCRRRCRIASASAVVFRGGRGVLEDLAAGLIGLDQQLDAAGGSAATDVLVLATLPSSA